MSTSVYVGMNKGFLFALIGTATAVPTSSPVVPVKCDGSTPSPCKCLPDDGFTTYTFTLNGDARCFTTYLPPDDSTRPMATMILPQCYLKSDPQNEKSHMVDFGRYGIASVFVSTSPTSTGNWDLPHIVNDTQPQVCTGSDADYMRVVFDFLGSHVKDFDPTNVHVTGHSQNSIFSAFTGFCFSEKVAGVFQASGGLTLVDEFKKYWTKRATGLKQVQGFLQECDTCQYWTVYPCYEPSRPVTNCFGSSTDDPFVWDDSYTRSTSQYGYEAAVKEGHVSASLVWGPPVTGHATGVFTTEWTIRCLGMLPECPESCWDGKQIDHSESQCRRCSPTKSQLAVVTPNMTVVGNFGTPGVRNKPQPRPPTSKCVHKPSSEVIFASPELSVEAVVV